MKKKASNPLNAWKQWREERSKKIREAAARKITNDRAENEQKIIGVLKGIDFFDNPIPREMLEYKTDPTQKYGDLKYVALALQGEINSTKPFPVDTKTIDEILFTLADQFAQSIGAGDVTAAFTAKAGLVRCVRDIRNKIPYLDKDRAEAFMENAAEYMKTWILLIERASVFDQLQREYENFQRSESEHKQNLETAAKTLDEMIMDRDHPEYAEALEFWRGRTYAEVDHADLTAEQKKIRDIQSNIYYLNKLVDFAGWQTQSIHQNLKTTKHEYDMLYIVVGKAVISEDPNAMEKYFEIINDSLNRITESDAKIKEFIDKTSELDGRMRQMKNMPGQQAELAIQERMADETLDRIKANQEKQIKGDKATHDEVLRRMGLRTDEELEEEKARIQKQQEEMMQQLHIAEELDQNAEQDFDIQENLNQNTEMEYNYNS